MVLGRSMRISKEAHQDWGLKTKSTYQKDQIVFAQIQRKAGKGKVIEGKE